MIPPNETMSADIFEETQESQILETTASRARKELQGQDFKVLKSSPPTILKKKKKNREGVDKSPAKLQKIFPFENRNQFEQAEENLKQNTVVAKETLTLTKKVISRRLNVNKKRIGLGHKLLDERFYEEEDDEIDNTKDSNQKTDVAETSQQNRNDPWGEVSDEEPVFTVMLEVGRGEDLDAKETNKPNQNCTNDCNLSPFTVRLEVDRGEGLDAKETNKPDQNCTKDCKDQKKSGLSPKKSGLSAKKSGLSPKKSGKKPRKQAMPIQDSFDMLPEKTEKNKPAFKYKGRKVLGKERKKLRGNE